MTRRSVLAAVLVAMASLSAQAQTVKVEFLMGKVNLVAQDASLRAIMNEWARVGGTRLVNPERLTGGPVTLELVGVPERQALDILMRDVGGYILGPRAALVAGVSSFDRLVVVAAVAGRPAPAGPAVAAPRPQLGRVVTPIEREPIVDDSDDAEPDTPERAELGGARAAGRPVPTPRTAAAAAYPRARDRSRPVRRPRRATRSVPSRVPPAPACVQPAPPAQPPARDSRRRTSEAPPRSASEPARQPLPRLRGRRARARHRAWADDIQ